MLKRLAGWLLALGLPALLGLPAQAATIRHVDIDGTAFIVIAGEILFGDERRFAEEALLHDEAIVAFNSPGGNLKAGIEIGKTIRMKGFKTVVVADHLCASACALAWLAGSPRGMAPDAKVGFHAAHREENGEKVATSFGNALVGAYLSQLGLSDRAIFLATAADPNKVAWLTMDLANSAGIDVRALPAPKRLTRAVPQQPRAETGQDWTSYGEWVQIASRRSLADAIEVADEARRHNANVSVFRYRNGWYGVVIGPFSAGRGAIALEALTAAGEVPQDSLVTRGQGFSEFAWGAAPRRRMADR